MMPSEEEGEETAAAASAYLGLKKGSLFAWFRLCPLEVGTW